MDVPPGAPRVGRYALLNIVGEGGFGVVRRAVHLDTGMIVAVKVMDKHQLRLNNMSPQVKREIAVLTVLRHPNIVAGYEVLTSRARIFVVMEYVDGGELFTLLARHRRLDEPTVKYLFYQLLDGLHYCHQRGVFHRDLKVRARRRLWGALRGRSGELFVAFPPSGFCVKGVVRRFDRGEWPGAAGQGGPCVSFVLLNAWRTVGFAFETRTEGVATPHLLLQRVTAGLLVGWDVVPARRVGEGGSRRHERCLPRREGICL